MIYRLGLDVGTASVGAAAVALTSDGQPDTLIWHHVRIFSEPLENGQAGLVSKKAGRRKARMQRRQIDRRASRLRRIAHLAGMLGLKREEIAPDDGSTLPYLRAQAATERVELEDLLRIFLRLSKRRGYRGEFKAKKKGEVAEGSSELTVAMRALSTERGIALKDENDTGITLGQYLLHRMENGLPTKLKVKEIGNDQKNKKTEDANAPKNLYALRKMVEHEFNTIWDTQTKHHAILNGTDDGKPIREHFYEALFYQRPLKSAADLVAQCSLEPTLPRAPRAQMAFQRFRIEKTLADLRWGAGRNAIPLSLKQKEIIRDLLNNPKALDEGKKKSDRNGAISFETIYEKLEAAGHVRPLGKGLNLDRASREELPGNKTLYAFHQLDEHSVAKHPDRAANLEQAFRALDDKTQIAVINFLAELGSPEQLDDPAWHTSFVKSVKDIKVKDKDGKERWQYKLVPRTFSPELITFINRIKEHDQFDRLGKMGFDGGRASYSAKAMNTLADWLQEPNWPGDWNEAKDGAMSKDEEGSIRACYRQRTKEQQKVVRQNRLPAPEPTGNAVVDGALRQIRWTVNKMIDEIGNPPHEIVVEFSREMSLGITRRNEREKEMTNNQKARREAEKKIRENNDTPTPSKIRRYLLWQEQETRCPYCNQQIELGEALCADTEYEHIIPKSLTQVGMKRSEIILAHHACNQEKGDFTPWERWGNTERWQSVEAAATRFEAKKHHRKAKLLRLKDFEREVLTDESVDGFADRQFHQTSWIGKEATQWLNCLCPNKVSPSRGELTAMLRRNWKLETVIPEVRYESDLPVLDEGGKADEKGKALPAKIISQDEFNTLKKFLEGHPIRREDREGNPGFDFNRRPDKRLDHRHHLIDAITLALTSRSLFQQMARNYKRAAEKLLPREGETSEERERRIKSETRLRLEMPEPPLRSVRAAALEAVRQCRISIKPDRNLGGRLFQDFAYRVIYPDGDTPARLARRKPVSELAGDSIEQSRKNINDIVSQTIRKIILKEFELRAQEGKTVKEIFLKPFSHPEHRTEIKKVFCLQKIGRGYMSTDGTCTVAHPLPSPRHEKRLLHDGYAYLELETTDGRFKSAQPVFQLDGQSKINNASNNVIRFYRNDTVLDAQNDKLYVIKQIKAQSGGMLIMAPITETLGVADMSSEFGLQTASGNALMRFKIIKNV